MFFSFIVWLCLIVAILNGIGALYYALTEQYIFSSILILNFIVLAGLIKLGIFG